MVRFRRPRSPVHTARRVVAFLLAAAALVLALRPDPGAVPAAAPTVPVAVSAGDLPPGKVLTRDDLTVTRLPAAVTPSGAVADPGSLVGRVLAGGVRAGEPLTDARLVGAGLSALLPEGQVAAPVRLADLAVAALVRTGDRVDVLATPPDAGPTELVADGALVLAAPGPAAGSGVDAGGLLLIAVDDATAARLAAASTTATLTVNLPRPDAPPRTGRAQGDVGG
jgi:Flp pilus assembly protein CpaB